MTVSVIAAVLLLPAGCGADGAGGGSRPGSDPPSPPVDEIAAHDGQVCPPRLPTGAEPGLRLGPDDRATADPMLTAPDRAWVCRYLPRDAPEESSGGGRFDWVRDVGARSVAAAALPALVDSLSALAAVVGPQACTADLGPRWLLVLAHGQDLTGVVVDDFGCRDVRLTDEPFAVVPGEGSRPGVFTGPPELVRQVEAAAR